MTDTVGRHRVRFVAIAALVVLVAVVGGIGLHFWRQRGGPDAANPRDVFADCARELNRLLAGSRGAPVDFGALAVAAADHEERSAAPQAADLVRRWSTWTPERFALEFRLALRVERIGSMNSVEDALRLVEDALPDINAASDSPNAVALLHCALKKKSAITGPNSEMIGVRGPSRPAPPLPEWLERASVRPAWLGWTRAEAQMDALIAGYYLRQGDFTAARVRYQRAISSAQRAHAPRLYAAVLVSYADCVSRFPSAADAIAEMLHVRDEIDGLGQRMFTAQVDMLLARIFHETRNGAEAWRHVLLGATVLQEGADDEAAVRSAASAAIIAKGRGLEDEARAWSELASVRTSQARNAATSAASLYAAALNAGESGDVGGQLALARKAVSTASQGGSRSVPPTYRRLLGTALLASSEFREADETLAQARSDAEAAGLTVETARCDLTRSWARMGLDEPGAAAESMAAARTLIGLDLALAGELAPELQQGTQWAARNILDEQLEALAVFGSAATQDPAPWIDALYEIADMARAQALASRISDGPRLASSAADPSVAADVTATFDQLCAARIALDSARRGTGSEALAVAVTAHDTAFEAWRHAWGTSATLVRRSVAARPMRPAPVVDLRAALGPRAAFLQLLTTKQRAFALVVRPSDTQFVALGGAADLDRAVRAWRNAIQSGADDRMAARSVSERILRPLEPLLDGYDEVVLSPDERMTAMPFGALIRSGGGRAIEHWRITMTPSASCLLALRERRLQRAGGGGALVVGPPLYGGDSGLAPLPGALAETAHAAATLVRGGIPAVHLQGSAASLEEVEAALRDHEAPLAVFHFAGHADTSSTHPGISALRLVDREKWTAEDVLRSRIATDLAIVSACDSAAGFPIPGEGRAGFARAFLGAGALCVIGANWEVPDADEPQLMAAFYDALISLHLAPSEALRHAKLERIARGATVREWAAFDAWGLPD